MGLIETAAEKSVSNGKLFDDYLTEKQDKNIDWIRIKVKGVEQEIELMDDWRTEQVTKVEPIEVMPLYKSDVFRVSNIFTDEVLEKLITLSELAVARNFSRPNGMNKNGLVLYEMYGLDVVNEYIKHVVLPLAQEYFPQWGMFSVDRQHWFTVHYSKDEDHDLDKHLDGAEVTFNICLKNTLDKRNNMLMIGPRNGEDLSELNAKEQKNKFENISNIAIMFLGQQYHSVTNEGKMDSDGKRINLVIRLLSTEFRRSPMQTYYSKCMAPDIAKA